MKKLNLGCGEDYREGWFNLDCRGNVKCDKKWNLDEFPYPFKRGEFDIVLINHVLEHLDKPIEVLREVSRISKKGAKIKVAVPHAISYANISDLQHKHNFTEHTFSDEHLREYEFEKLRLIGKKFIFKNKWKIFIPFKKYLKIFFNGVYDDLVFEFEVL